MRNKFKAFSERYHGELHLFFGLLSAFIAYLLFRRDVGAIMTVAVIGSFLPDIDHLFFLFFYGRKTKYASEAREILFSQGVREYIGYCKINHKDNTEIKSHNIVVVLVLLGLAVLFWKWEKPVWMAFFLSTTFHFVFDMMEDILFFGKLNGNWWLKYGSKR